MDRWGRPAPLSHGPDPLLYRLWGLPPLQTQILYGDELVAEVWTRPSRTVRQTVTRVTLRRDGEAFVQARAGLACCDPQIGRRVGFDAGLAPAAAAALRALRDDPLWSAPRDVAVNDGDGAVDAICLDGTAYHLILATAGRTVALRRACDAEAVGQAAAVLQAVLRSALGHEPRFDVLFPDGADFSAEHAAYQALIARGGALRAVPPRSGP